MPKETTFSRRQTTLVIMKTHSTSATVKTLGSHLREWISVFISRTAAIIQVFDSARFCAASRCFSKCDFTNKWKLKKKKNYTDSKIRNLKRKKKKKDDSLVQYAGIWIRNTHLSFTYGTIITDSREAGNFGDLPLLNACFAICISWFWCIADGRCKYIIFIKKSAAAR